MSKYMVLFTPESVDPNDDSLKGRLSKMLFAYPEPENGWTFDSAQAAHDDAVSNDYVPGKDFIVVRVVATKSRKRVSHAS